MIKSESILSETMRTRLEMIPYVSLISCKCCFGTLFCLLCSLSYQIKILFERDQPQNSKIALISTESFTSLY